MPGRPEGVEAPLTIVAAVVRSFEGGTLEDQLRQFEIDAVLGQISGPLALVLFERLHVYVPSVRTRRKEDNLDLRQAHA